MNTIFARDILVKHDREKDKADFFQFFIVLNKVESYSTIPLSIYAIWIGKNSSWTYSQDFVYQIFVLFKKFVTIP